MPSSQTERLTAAFYDWELRGRGWAILPFETQLEPAFVPFLRSSPATPIDDGRHHTWLSALVERWKGGTPAAPADPALSDDTSAPPGLPADEELWFEEFRLAIPADLRVSRDAIGRWLQSFVSASSRSAFELVGEAHGVEVRLALPHFDAGHLLSQLQAQLPGIVANRVELDLLDRWREVPGARIVAVEFGLAGEFMVPLALERTEQPLLPVIAALAEVDAGELGLVQVLFEPCRHEWAKSVVRAVTTSAGEPFFADAPEITALAREKVASPLFAVALRVAGVAANGARAWDIVRRVGSAFAPIGTSGRNELLPLAQPEEGDPEADILRRATHRSGMLLSADELAALLHLPGAGVQIPGLWRATERTKAAPAEVEGSGCHIGVNEHAGERRDVRLTVDTRTRHVHILGASGTGKSTLLVRMVLEDIEAGHAVALIDPHGDLVDEVASRMPADRLGASVLFDPSDEPLAIGWNMLSADSEAERELLASDLVSVFRRLSTSWGDQMTAVLGNAIQVFLQSPRGGTLLDLRRFLTDPAFRKELVATIDDPYATAFWMTDFPRLVGRRPEVPILTRLDQFLRSRLVRRVVTATGQRLDFRALTDGGGILLAKLAGGEIGEENAALLGSLLVSKLHQVTLTRAAHAASARRPVFLYADEFHAIATASMASLFSGARKYRLGVTVAHQDLSQIHTTMPELERSILANAYTRICFRLGDDDARQVARGLSFFTADDLTNLGLGEAICRVGGRTGDFNLRTEPLPTLSRHDAGERREQVRQFSARWGARGPAPPASVVQEPREKVVPEAAQTAPQPTGEAKRRPEAPREKAVPAPPEIDKLTLDYLALVARSPFLTVRERNAALGLSAWKGDRIKSAVVADGLAVEVTINPGGRGEQLKLLELTELGLQLVARFGIAAPAGHGRGGAAHQWWAQRIAGWLREAGHQATIEDSSRGARVDLLWDPSGADAIAVEIEMTDRHAIENVRKDLAAGFGLVVCLLGNPDDEAKLRSKLPDDQRDKVVIADLRNFEAVLTDVLSSVRRPNQNEEPRRRRAKPERSMPSPSLALPPATQLFEPGAYSTPLAADYLGLSPATLETMRVRGGGPAFSKLGRRVVYQREDLDAWLSAQKRRSTSDPG